MAPLAAGSEGPKANSRPRAWSWAALIATLHDPVVIRKLLAHLGIARSGPSPGPAPPAPGAAAP